MDRYGETCFGCVAYPFGCGFAGRCVLSAEAKRVRADVTARYREGLQSGRIIQRDRTPASIR
jgi:hypothetical protein